MVRKLTPPKRVVWCDSPLIMCIVRAIMLSEHTAKLLAKESVKRVVADVVGKEVKQEVADKPWIETRKATMERVADQTWRSVSAAMNANTIVHDTRENVVSRIREYIRAMNQLRSEGKTGEPTFKKGRLVKSSAAEVASKFDPGMLESVYQALADTLGQSGDLVDKVFAKFITDGTWNNVWEAVRASIYGQHEAIYGAHYDFYKKVGNLGAGMTQSDGHWTTNRNVGWWLPHENICWATERTSVLTLDDDGRLHGEDAPAISYRDGFSTWIVHGVRVPKQVVVSPETQTLKQIDDETNEEVRRIRIERYGWPKYLRDVGAKSIDSRRNDADGTDESLMRLHNGSLRMVVACRSTARVYAIGVPNEIKSCEEAQYWMSGGSSLAVKRNIIGAS
jgi:hypothetical protein